MREENQQIKKELRKMKKDLAVNDENSMINEGPSSIQKPQEKLSYRETPTNEDKPKTSATTRFLLAQKRVEPTEDEL